MASQGVFWIRELILIGDLIYEVFDGERVTMTKHWQEFTQSHRVKHLCHHEKHTELVSI